MSKPLVLVIVVGMSSICDEKTQYPLPSNLSRIVETIPELKNLGNRIVLATSDAVDYLYTDNSRIIPDARPVLVCDNIKKLWKQISVSVAGSSLGTGDMMTKLVVANLSAAAGVNIIIARGAVLENTIPIVMKKSPLYTRFIPLNFTWLAYSRDNRDWN